MERLTVWIGICLDFSKCVIHRLSFGSSSVPLVGSSLTHLLYCSAAVHLSSKERIGRRSCDAPLNCWSKVVVLWFGRLARVSATRRPLRIWVLSSTFLSPPLSDCVGELLLCDRSRRSGAHWGLLERVPELLRAQFESGVRWPLPSEQLRP